MKVIVVNFQVMYMLCMYRARWTMDGYDLGKKVVVLHCSPVLS